MVSSNSGVSISINDGIHVIRFDNPSRRNAIRTAAYAVMTKSLKDAAINPDIFMTVFTGTGDYYSSGFDISETTTQSDNNEEMVAKNLALLRQFLEALIDYPKLLVALVNGPAVGLAVTMLGLIDIVYASDTATFQTPFSSLGLCAEGCASYTFPRILGRSKAMEVLLTSHKMSAQEAHQFGLVSTVFKFSELDRMWEKIKEFRELSQNSILLSKQLIRKFDAANLHTICKIELDNVQNCFQSEDFFNALLKFLSRKNKSKL